MKYLDLLLVFCISLLLAYDFFPKISQTLTLPISFFLLLTVGLLLISVLFKRNRNADDKEVLKWQVFITTYLLFLILLFTVLGGKSTTGISFSNGFLWIMLLISIFDIFSRWKKIKKLK